MLSSNLIFVERDLGVFFIPPKYLWVGMVRSFELPLWNPYNYSGIPLLATLQPGIFYPPHLFYLFLPFNIVWNWLIILHFAFAGFTLYLLMRYLKASPIASLCSGIIFILSGYLLSVHNLLPHLFSVAWFPLIVLYFLKYFEYRRIKYIVITSILLSMQFFAGAPEIVMMTISVLVIIAVVSGRHFSRGIRYYEKAGAIVLVVALFALVVAVQFIPFYELKLLSWRRTGLNYGEAIRWSFAWKDFLMFFLPDVFGYFQTTEKYLSNQTWLKTIYLGIIPFVLTLFYLTSRDRKRWLLLLLMGVSLILALGGNTPIYRLLYHVPPFHDIRYPVKFLFLFFIIISITSGLGLDALRKGLYENDKRTRRIIQGVFYFGFVLVALWGYINIFENDVHGFLERYGLKPDAYNDINFNMHNLKRFLFFSFIFCVSLFLYLRTKYKKTMEISIICILAMDLFLANYGYYFTAPWRTYIEKNEFVKELEKNQETERYIVTPKTSQEFDRYPNDHAIMGSAYAALFNLYTFRGSEVLKIHDNDVLSRLLQYYVDSPDEAKRFLDVIGVKYLITSHEIKSKEYVCVKSIAVNGKTAHLYEYKGYPGRFLLFGKIHTVHDDQAAVNTLTDGGIDLRKELVITDDGMLNQWQNRTVKGNVRLVSYKANKVVLESDADNAAFLYVSDTYYPGWRAYVDGKQTKIYRANLAFRAVEVPKGKHTVVFKYVPMSLYIGLCLTIIGILICIWLWRRDRKDNDQ